MRATRCRSLESGPELVAIDSATMATADSATSTTLWLPADARSGRSHAGHRPQLELLWVQWHWSVDLISKKCVLVLAGHEILEGPERETEREGEGKTDRQTERERERERELELENFILQGL